MPGPLPDRPTDLPAAARRDLVVVAGHLGDRATVEAGLSDPDPVVRIAAVGAAERVGLLTGPALGRLLSDHSPAVRRRATAAAAHRTDARSELVALLGDEDPTVVDAAAFAWGERPDADAEVVDRLATVARTHTDHLCRESAVAALGSVVATRPLPDRAAATALDAVLAGTRDRASVRRRAVLALAAFDHPAATAALESLSEDRDLQVRQAAEDLLAIEEGDESG